MLSKSKVLLVLVLLTTTTTLTVSGQRALRPPSNKDLLAPAPVPQAKADDPTIKNKDSNNRPFSDAFAPAADRRNPAFKADSEKKPQINPNENKDTQVEHAVKHEHKPDHHDHSDPHPAINLLFSLSLVVAAGIGGGRLAERFRQPAMLGMLLTGLLLRNLFRTIILPLPHSWTTPLWTIALSAVTARAGLSLQATVISTNLVPTVLLGSIPVLCETAFLAGLVRVVFHLPAPWCFTLSFGVASVSPGVVVPLLLNLMDRPGWKGSRIPPTLLAATGLDVLIATSGFGIALAAVFGHAHEYEHPDPSIPTIEHISWYTRAAEELLLGVGGGLVLGVLSVFLARSKRVAESVATMIVFSITTFGMMVLKTNGFPGAASSLVVVCWAVIGNGWEKDQMDASNKRLKMIWNLAEPFLFPLIGASVCFIEIRPIVLALSMLCVFISICVRMTINFFTAQAASFSIDEQIFTCGLWAGKGSVQAALSTTTMELVHQYHLQHTESDEYSRIVFACMVSAIMLAGPFAAAWVSIFGHRGEESPSHHGGRDSPLDRANLDKL